MRRPDGYYVTACMRVAGRPHQELRDVGPVASIDEAEKMQDEVHAAVRTGIEICRAQIRAAKMDK